MTYQDQPYYRDYVSLLQELRTIISSQKKLNQTLEEQNHALNAHIQQLQSELDHLNEQLVQHESDTPPPANVDTPGLFDQLPDNERLFLRNQISEMISKIDRHLDS